MKRNGEPFLFVPDQISLPRDIVIECSFPSDFLQYCSRQVQCRRNTGGRGVIAPRPPLPDFGRYVKSYFFMGAVYAHYINILPPSGFSGLPTVLISLLFVAKTSDECTKENSAPDALGKII